MNEILISLIPMNLSIGGDLTPSLEGMGKNFADQERIFREKNSIFTTKISDDLFLVIDHDFRIFPTFNIFAACDVVFDPFFTRKSLISEYNSFTTPFLLCSCFRAHPTNATSQNIGGRMHGPSPHLKILGGPSPSPLSSPPMVRRTDRLSECLFVYSSLCTHVCLSISLSLCLSVYLSLHSRCINLLIRFFLHPSLSPSYLPQPRVSVTPERTFS